MSPYSPLRKLPIALLLLSCLQPAQAAAPARAAEMTVYRSPTCGCCGKWVEHMKKNGYTVKDIQTEDMPAIKQQYGVPAELASCHTAIVNGYVVEGHVPVADVNDVLKKKPVTHGIAVPGMPMGTPGMEMGGKKDPYAVVQFDKDGKATVFHDYPMQ